ncbi:MAG: P63C domain-containing protein [Thermodesulfobacteriota bacterium]
MSAASRIIEKFGGQTALAKLLGKNQSTIQNWHAKGRIPAKWQQPLLELAEKYGISLSPSDFFLQRDTPPDDKPPTATHPGELHIGGAVLPCYVLETGDRVFSLTGAMASLFGVKSGSLADYLKAKAVKPYMSNDLTPAENNFIPALIKFDTGGHGIAKEAWGLPVEKFMDICAAYSAAAEQKKLTDRQVEIAVKANAFLRACAKVGIIALVDEATGYQYDRTQDALRFKLKLYLEEEMREWEKTFPDELWLEFGRLTRWDGPVHLRPKYWGKLVMELVYEYLDHDVAEWLKNNAPKPRAGQNYHQWLNSQYGLKKLIEHLWMLIGMARTCETMTELRRKVAEQFGRIPIQMTFYLPLNTKRGRH